MSSQPPFHLTSLIDLQTNYLNTLPTDLSNNDKYTALQTNLNNLNSQVSEVQEVLSSELGNLKEVDSLLTSEKSDLDLKKQQVDGAHFAKMRELSFMESRRKRQSEFTNIYYILFIALIVFIALIALSRFTGISDNLQVVFGLIIFSIAGLIIVNKYLQIRKRDVGDYDKLSLAPPVAPYMTESEIAAAQRVQAASAQSIAPTTCAQATCGDGTTLDTQTNKCVVSPTTVTPTPVRTTNGFSNIEDTKYVYDVIPFETNKKSVYAAYA